LGCLTQTKLLKHKRNKQNFHLGRPIDELATQRIRGRRPCKNVALKFITVKHFRLLRW
jgi:hypothetical protein